MAFGKRNSIDSLLINFKNPPEQPLPTDTYRNFGDNYSRINNRNNEIIDNNEMKYIRRRYQKRH